MQEIFKTIPHIKYEGPDTGNSLAFRYYNPEHRLQGKKMSEHMRFSMAFWHSMNAVGADPFGAPTAIRPWDKVGDDWKQRETKIQAIFELTTKLQIPFFCFHDRDIAPEGATLRESNQNLDRMVGHIEQMFKDYPTRLLWGTAQLFLEPRYMNGAATSPDPQVFAYAAGQVKKALEVTLRLGGQNYVFWGGREGYETLLNTDMKRELDNMGYFLQMARDYARKIGFKGQLLLEPKPKEPSKHQYDSDTAAVWGFLQEYNLEKDFKLNIETNHATLAGHTMEHELALARIKGILGSVDANEGDMLLGWDTDQFPHNIYIASSIMLQILLNKGLGSGGLNFDSKLRRPSTRVEDLAQAHILGMDTMARGLLIANAMVNEGSIMNTVSERYSGFHEGIGKGINERTATLENLAAWVEDRNVPATGSARQEFFESLVNRFI